MGIRPARDFFDDRPQQEITRVAVCVAAARFELQRIVLEGIDHLTRRQVFRHVCFKAGLAGKVGDARGMRQQLLDGDALAAGRVVGQEFGDVVVQGQLAFIGQHQDGGGGELLGDRGDAHHGVRRHGLAFGDVGHAIGFAEHRLAGLGDDDGGAGLASFEQGRYGVVDAGGQGVILGPAGRGVQD